MNESEIVSIDRGKTYTLYIDIENLYCYDGKEM